VVVGFVVWVEKLGCAFDKLGFGFEKLRVEDDWYCVVGGLRVSAL
jgi:hypothetical protein